MQAFVLDFKQLICGESYLFSWDSLQLFLGLQQPHPRPVGAAVGGIKTGKCVSLISTLVPPLRPDTFKKAVQD